MDWRARLVSTPGICHGQVCVKGTRIPASVVLDNIAAGALVQDLLASYPALTADDVGAIIQYAAELARERVVPLAAFP